MEFVRKELSEVTSELFKFPEVLASRHFIWAELEKAGEPAPRGVFVAINGVHVQRRHMTGVCLRARGGRQLRYIAAAVERLVIAERAGILHGDLKTEHILLRPDGSVRWIDWDLAISSASGAAGVWGIGTPEFMAPEKVSLGITTCSTEIYSLGKIFLEQDEVLKNSDFRKFAESCSSSQPSDRPSSFLELLAHLKPFL